ILDLSKIESGTVTVDLTEVTFGELADYLDRAFRHMAEAKGLDFRIARSPELPPLFHTDVKRLQQILKNLLANAFKFTERGSVIVEITRAAHEWEGEGVLARPGSPAIVLAVTDTGI